MDEETKRELAYLLSLDPEKKAVRRNPAFVLATLFLMLASVCCVCEQKPVVRTKQGEVVSVQRGQWRLGFHPGDFG